MSSPPYRCCARTAGENLGAGSGRWCSRLRRRRLWSRMVERLGVAEGHRRAPPGERSGRCQLHAVEGARPPGKRFFGLARLHGARSSNDSGPRTSCVPGPRSSLARQRRHELGLISAASSHSCHSPASTRISTAATPSGGAHAVPTNSTSPAATLTGRGRQPRRHPRVRGVIDARHRLDEDRLGRPAGLAEEHCAASPTSSPQSRPGRRRAGSST